MKGEEHEKRSSENLETRISDDLFVCLVCLQQLFVEFRLYQQAVGEVATVGEDEFAAVAFGDGVGDGESESGALLFRAEYAVEGIGYAATFGGGDAGAVVFHPDGEGGRGLAETYVDAAACGGVADGVVGEGFDEGVDFGVVGSDAQVVFDGDADVLLFVKGEGHEFLQHAAKLGLQADVGQVALGFGTLGAGVGQELLEQVAVALYALENESGLFAGFVRLGQLGEPFCLKGEGGQWAAQFVGGIGDEALLAADVFACALQQLVDGGNEALYFAGHAFSVQRREVV